MWVASCPFPTPPYPQASKYKMLPIWQKDFSGGISTPWASWVGGMFYFKIGKGPCSWERGVLLTERKLRRVQTRVFFHSPKHYTPALPRGHFCLSHQAFHSLIIVSRYCMLFFFFCKCLSINLWLSPLWVLEGFRASCFYILSHIFHSHLGILDVGQLVGSLGCRET